MCREMRIGQYLAAALALYLSAAARGHDLDRNPGRSPLGEGAAVLAPMTQPATAPTEPATQPAALTEPAETQPASTRPAASRPSRKPMVGWLEISGRIADSPLPLAWVDEEEQKSTLRGLVGTLDRIANDKRYLGVVLYLPDPELRLAQVKELTAAIARVQDAGKKVLAFAEAYELSGYLLACAADKVVLQTNGELFLAPLEVEEVYLAGMLEKIGVRADLMQVGRFKGAREPLTNTRPSEEWSQNMEGLLDDLYGQIVAIVAERRGLEAAQVERALAESWAMTDREYVESRLVDAVSDRSLTSVSGELFGSNFEWDQEMLPGRERQQAQNPFAIFQKLMQGQKQTIKRPSIMVVRASGVITMGDSQVGGEQAGAFGVDSIGSGTMAEVLAEARKNDYVKGVILRIDSPGGSAVASEAIWQAIHQTAQSKPVYASIGPMAASGGYYMACAADRIFVNDASIVGSIGVVGGKLVLGGLYEKLGLYVQRRWRGQIGDVFNSVEPFTAAQKQSLLKAMQHTYDVFVERVKAGRGERLADVAAVAEGRLFTGRQAVTNGLADELGGLDRAVAAMAQQLGLQKGQYDLVDRPQPLSLSEYLQNVFGASAPPGLRGADMAGRWAGWAEVWQQVLGARSWPAVSRALSGIMLLSGEPVLTLLPAAISIQ